MYRNSEGYSDPTAGAAMSSIMREYKQKRRELYAQKNRRKVYVVSPYAGDTTTNTCKAIRYCQHIIKDGHMPIASHLLYPQMLNDSVPEERELGIMFGLALLAMCDEVWVFGEPSPGMKQEIAEAKKLGKRVRYVTEVA